MEKRGLIVCLVIVALFFIFAKYAKITGYVVEGGAPVDQEVIEKVKEEGKADIIVVLKDPKPNLNFMAKEEVNDEKVLDKLSESEIKKKHELKSVNAFSGEVTLSGLNKLKTDLNVERIELNHPMQIFLQDTINIIHASDVHEMGYTGSGQSVCIVDTGVNYNHADLGGCFGAGCKVIGGYDIYNNDSDPMDDNGHGTHVAGIVAANGGVVGIAKNANIVAVKVFDANGYGSEADIIKGVEWCIEHKQEFNIIAISMSLGTSSTYDSYCDALFPSLSAAVNTAVNNGISVISATGNAGSTTEISSPACLENTIAVGSTDKADNVASYSNRNSITDLLAPGSSITSTWLTGTKTLSGTSMSVPHVSATIAILKEFDESLTVNEIKTALNEGVIIEDVNQNFTRVDVLEAILSFDETPPGINFVEPTPLNNALVNVSFFVNITSNEKLSSAILDFNNENITMLGSEFNFYYNKTAFSGNYSYRVYGYDLAGNLGVSEERNISVYNPLNVIFNPDYRNANIKEPDNFTFSVEYEEENLSVNWFKDSINVGNENYYNFIGNYDSAGYYNITCCVEIVCNEWNLSINNTNRAPVLENIIGNKTWNENTNLSLDLSNYFKDYDNDSLSYWADDIENISVYLINSSVILEPDKDFIGESYGKFYCNDSEFNTSSNLVSFKITNVVVCGDGKIEGNEECDSDNLNGKTCSDFGYDTGTLKCTNCLFDISECENTTSGSGGGTGGGSGGGGTPLEETFDEGFENVESSENEEKNFETMSEPAEVKEPNPEEEKTEKITGKATKSKITIDSPIWYLVLIAVGLILLILVLKKFKKL